MDNNLKVHYFIDQNGIYETLIMQKYLKVVNGASYIITKPSFKGQLKLYFQDCPGILHGIDNISYIRNDLIKLFYEYYKCTSKETLYQTEIEKFKSEFGILGGVSQTKLRLVGSEALSHLPILIIHGLKISCLDYFIISFYHGIRVNGQFMLKQSTQHTWLPA